MSPYIVIKKENFEKRLRRTQLRAPADAYSTVVNNRCRSVGAGGGKVPGVYGVLGKGVRLSMGFGGRKVGGRPSLLYFCRKTFLSFNFIFTFIFNVCNSFGVFV